MHRIEQRFIRRRFAAFCVPIASAAVLLHATKTERLRRGEDLWARTVAVYAALESYADTGAVDVAYGTAAAPSHDWHSFRTYFRKKPRGFFFEFVKTNPKPNVAVWVDPNAAHEWTTNSGREAIYESGRETIPFALNSYPTNGTIVMIPGLLFPRAKFAGTLTELDQVEDAGMETVDGRKCHTLKGVASDTYGTSGKNVNARKVTVWIDAQTLMVVRLFEEWEPATPSLVSTQTTTFRAHPNATLDDKRFAFVPPRAQ